MEDKKRKEKRRKEKKREEDKYHKKSLDETSKRLHFPCHIYQYDIVVN